MSHVGACLSLCAFTRTSLPHEPAGWMLFVAVLCSSSVIGGVKVVTMILLRGTFYFL